MGWHMGCSPRGAGPSDRHVPSTMPVAAHRPAVEAIRSGPGDPPVGLTLSMTDYQARRGRGAGWSGSGAPRGCLPGGHRRGRLHRGPDLHPHAGRARRRPRSARRASPPPDGLRVLARGARGHHPTGLAEVTGGLPVCVTENGIGTEDDADRIEFVGGPCAGVRRCLDDGIDVRGYFYWSLLDNFEWVARLRPQVRPGGGGPPDLRPQPQAQCDVVGQCARADGL